MLLTHSISTCFFEVIQPGFDNNGIITTKMPLMLIVAFVGCDYSAYNVNLIKSHLKSGNYKTNKNKSICHIKTQKIT